MSEFGRVLATGEAFRAIRDAIDWPEKYCKQITSFPKPTRQMEPMSRWQTRAVMTALANLAKCGNP